MTPSATPAVTKANFDPDKATEAYLATVKRQGARALRRLFRGRLLAALLVDTLYTIVVAGLLLWLKISARMRDLAQSITRSRFWQVPIYVDPIRRRDDRPDLSA